MSTYRRYRKMGGSDTKSGERGEKTVDKSEFGARLKALRKEKGLSQEGLAQELFLTRAVISAYETAEKYPRVDTLIRIAAYFDCSIDYLLGLDDGRYIRVDELSGREQELLVRLVKEMKGR